MTKPKYALFSLAAVLGALSAPVHATVKIVEFKPSAASPQAIGTSITWTAKATDTNTSQVTFQFSVAPPGGTLAVVRNYNAGTHNGTTWTARNLIWAATQAEGVYKLQITAKDFTTGATDSRTVPFRVTPLATGSTPVVVATANPLVALFSAPSCPAGSTMRVSFQPASGDVPAVTTSWVNCHPPATMNFEIAGMYESTAYNMFSQTETSGNMVNGPTVSFTTGALPSKIVFPQITMNKNPGANTDTNDWMILHSLIALGKVAHYPQVVTDLYGKFLWYYVQPGAGSLLTRPLQGGGFLAIQSGAGWDVKAQANQIARQVDLAGNVLHETNTGILQQQLIALGDSNAQPCSSITNPVVGSACLGGLHHEVTQSFPNGYTALLADIEKIFPAGTQGDTTGLPVDIIGDVIIVMDENWQVVWYFDTFDHDTGPPQLDINRPPVLGETCIAKQGGCPPVFLLGPGIAPKAHDWLHANSVYYWPAPQNGTSKGDIIWSSRHQDWVMRVNYQDTAGTGDILWRLGPCGDFTFNNTNNDPWPWNSHQHEVAMENDGAGPLSLFDNGNTRVSPPSGPHSSSGCLAGTGSGDSRGMALTVDETTMQVTPVISQDLGVLSIAMGSAQLLEDGNFFFEAPFVVKTLNKTVSYAIELYPTAGTVNGTQVLNQEATEGYRGWQFPSMYAPPIS